MNARLDRTLARSRVYGFLSLAFTYPDAASLSSLSEESTRLEETLARLSEGAGIASARWLRPIIAGLTLEDWLAAHGECFGHTISKECPPYECEYGQAHIFQKTQRLADLAGFYRAFGLECAPAAQERVDHISVELEFMYFLCIKEAYALEHRHKAARRAQCRAAQRLFLGEHLGTWAPSFARLLARVAGGGLYGSLAELLGAFLAAELRAHDLQPQPLAVGERAPFPMVVTEDCLGCGAAPEAAGLRGG